MHELSICGSIAGIVSRHAGARRVETIHLQVGQLRQIVPDTLVYCWSLVSADTELAGSVLVIESVPARIACRDCGLAGGVDTVPMLVCAGCRSTEVSIVAGEEFMITSLDLAEV